MRHGLSLRRYGPSPGSHAHAHFQVLWGWRGTLELELEGRGMRIGVGRVAVIPPQARHDFQAARGDCACLVLDTGAAVLEPWAGRDLAVDPATLHLLHFLAAQPAQELPAAAAELLLGTLANRDGMHGTGNAPVRTRRTIAWAALAAWADAHLAERLSVADLAARVCLSPTQFAARCRAETGLAPMTWLRARRLALARAARAAGEPVYLAAARCGYRSPSALTAALRRGAGR